MYSMHASANRVLPAFLSMTFMPATAGVSASALKAFAASRSANDCSCCPVWSHYRTVHGLRARGFLLLGSTTAILLPPLQLPASDHGGGLPEFA
jgi:hypothetical protein